MSKYKCNICGWTGDQFNYMSTQPNVKCPDCSSLERHRSLVGFLRNKDFFGKRGGKCLEIGPPRQAYQKIMAENFDYVTGDLDSPLATHKVDITAMPFADEEFDVIICFHVLEHIPDDQKAMRELHRCLKHDGIMFLAVPLNADGKTREFDEPDPDNYLHVREYSTDILWRLTEAGFDVEVIQILKHLTKDEIEQGNLRTAVINAVIGVRLLFLCRRLTA